MTTAGNGDAEFWERLEAAFADGSYLGSTLSQRRSEDSPERLVVRPTTVKGAHVFQWASRTGTRETHQNLDSEPTMRRIRELLGPSYARAHIFTIDADYDVSVTPEGRLRVHRSRPTRSAVPLEHNRAKSHLLSEHEPIPFLVEIGVMTPAGKVKASKQAKFRQINRFLEMVNDVIPHLPASGALRVVDFGSGKSYLTFALYHLLTQIHQRSVHILGLDRQAQVIADCQRIAKKLDCKGLEFRVGEIGNEPLEGTVDLAVSLHACDTATDDALARAVVWRAAVILAVPCCQHELARQIHMPQLAAVHHQGILHAQFASLATDALRAQALEACGYKTQVIEFIELEHTAKNLLLRAVRRPESRPSAEAVAAAYGALKQSLGLDEIASDRILAAQGPPPAGTA
jgi:SAM-dependent methyltransferase